MILCIVPILITKHGILIFENMIKVKYIITSIIMIALLNGCSLFYTTPATRQTPTPNYTEGNFQYCVMRNGYWSDWTCCCMGCPIKFYNDHFILFGFNDYTGGGYRKVNPHPSEYHIKVSYNLSSEKKESNYYVYDIK